MIKTLQIIFKNMVHYGKKVQLLPTKPAQKYDTISYNFFL